MDDWSKCLKKVYTFDLQITVNIEDSLYLLTGPLGKCLNWTAHILGRTCIYMHPRFTGNKLPFL